MLAILSIAAVVFASGGSATRDAFLLHSAILGAFALSTRLATRGAEAAWVPWLRSTATVAVILTLYSTLAEPAFVVIGGSRDAALASIDRALACGVDPALAVEPWVDPFRLELFALVYGWFIPFLYISIFLGCFGRPDEERDDFLFGLSLTYAISYLGYLLVPARGPIEHYAFQAELAGGQFHRIVLAGVEATGGNHGAFPSLHVGATAFVCFYDLRRHPLRGMTYVPMVALITVSTVVLRYHYVIDLIAGLGIAALCAAIARRRGSAEVRR